jgi:BTB/POZ domain
MLHKVKSELLENTVKIQFCDIQTEANVLSPEDKSEMSQCEALDRINQCKNLNDFFDVLFMVDDTLIKGNSLILKARSPYFAAMLSNSYGFRESNLSRGSSIKVTGVPKLYFNCLLEYVYSDHFFIHKHSIEFFVKLLIFADYFMLPRLVDICSRYLQPFVTISTSVMLLLVAHSHNAEQLERYCVNFIAMNDKEVVRSRQYKLFRERAHPQLIEMIEQKIKKEVEENFI